MAKKGYYAVARGRETGIFNTWAECEAAVKSYPNAKFKKFESSSEASEFVSGSSKIVQRITGIYPAGLHDRSSGSSSNNRSSGGSSNNRSSGGSSNYYNNPYDNGPYGGYSGPYGGYSGESSRNYSDHSGDSSSNKSNSGSSFYAVRSNNPDAPSKVFNNWSDCQAYVHGKRHISFKKFPTREQANAFSSGEASMETTYAHMNTTQSEFKRQYGIPRDSSSKVQVAQTPSHVYCDGSSLNNGYGGARAGYGVYFEDENIRVAKPLDSGPQTNNRAELMAVHTALDHIWDELEAHSNGSRPQVKKYAIHTDSEYVVKLLNDYSKHSTPQELKAAPNGDIVAPLVQTYNKVKQFYDVNKSVVGEDGLQVEWVKGHAGVPGNEVADQLAREGAAAQRR